MEIKVGLKGESMVIVKDGNTAMDFGSGNVPVLATPMLIALMEGAAINAVERFLPDGQTTVGTLIECRHLAATPKGMTVIVTRGRGCCQHFSLCTENNSKKINYSSMP